MNTEAVINPITEFTREIQKLKKTDAAVCILLQLDAIRPNYSAAEFNSLLNIILTRYATATEDQRI